MTRFLLEHPFLYSVILLGVGFACGSVVGFIAGLLDKADYGDLHDEPFRTRTTNSDACAADPLKSPGHWHQPELQRRESPGGPELRSGERAAQPAYQSAAAVPPGLTEFIQHERDGDQHGAAGGQAAPAQEQALIAAKRSYDDTGRPTPLAVGLHQWVYRP